MEPPETHSVMTRDVNALLAQQKAQLGQHERLLEALIKGNQTLTEQLGKVACWASALSFPVDLPSPVTASLALAPDIYTSGPQDPDSLANPPEPAEASISDLGFP